jgi:putative transposase
MPIFTEGADYLRFQALLYLANNTSPVHFQALAGTKIYLQPQEEPIVAIGAYCLMSNHFHILVKEIREGGISNFMRRLTTAYSMYFNIKNERRGPLFESRFKSTIQSRDEQLKYLYSYIHLNPIKKVEPLWKEVGIKNIDGAMEYLNQFSYSSFLDYKDVSRSEGKILNRAEFPDYFKEKDEFLNNIMEWLTFNDTHQGPSLISRTDLDELSTGGMKK